MVPWPWGGSGTPVWGWCPVLRSPSRWQLKSTPDLLRDQQEVAQPGSSEDPKEVIYGILKEG